MRLSETRDDFWGVAQETNPPLAKLLSILGGLVPPKNSCVGFAFKIY